MLLLEWSCKPFDELNAHELYAIIQLRNEVFVVEQNCPFQDADDKDQQCYHLAGHDGLQLAAYARLVPPGVAYPYISIGRVVTAPKYRKHGAGKALMTEAIRRCIYLFGNQTIKIGGQLYLKKFYEGFGFAQSSDIYDEDGIAHIHMLRQPELL